MHTIDLEPVTSAWGTVVRTGAGSAIEASNGRCTVAVEPDFEMADKWGRALKRIHHVEIRRHDGWEAWIHGTGHRAPTARRISLSTAIALALGETPLLLSLDRDGSR